MKGSASRNAGKKYTAAVFDMSSGSVGGAHVHVAASQSLPTITSSHRVFLPLEGELQIERFVENTVSALQKVIGNITKTDTHRPEYVQFILASPWFISQTRTILYRKTTPFTFTQKMLDEMIDKEIAHVLEHELESFGSFGAEGKIIERQISLIKLNGYVSNEPFGKRAQEVELYLTITLTPTGILNRLKEAVRAYYQDVRVGFTTAPYTTFVVHRDFLGPENDVTIIDVGEDVTDIAFVKGGLFLYQHSFPVGTYGLVRALMQLGSHTLTEAESLLAAYRNGHLASSVQQKVEEAVIAYQKEWQNGIESVLQNGHFGFALPPLTLLSADTRYELLFESVLKQSAVLRFLTTVPEITVSFLNEDHFSLSPESVVIDVPLILGCLFVSRHYL